VYHVDCVHIPAISTCVSCSGDASDMLMCTRAVGASDMLTCMRGRRLGATDMYEAWLSRETVQNHLLSEIIYVLNKIYPAFI